MSHPKTIQLKSYLEDTAIRAGTFSLLPENPSLPLIISQPIKNFAQFSWIESFIFGAPVFQQIELTNNTVNMLEGTEFSLGIKALDPSNVNDVNSTEFLSYKWKKDDALLYDINRLNGGVGTSEFYIEASSSGAELTGRYMCEVENPYGTTDTETITINVIDPFKHPKLYKNLVLNGDGDGGLNEWEGDPEIRVSPFVKTLITRNFGSYRLGSMLIFDYNFEEGVKDSTPFSPNDFFFSIGDHSSLFINFFYKAWASDPAFRNITIKLSSFVWTEPEKWLACGSPSQIIPNEDYQKSDFAAFFPGPRLLDTYNKNNNLIGVVNEFTNYTPTYFTRDKLKFEKYGGKQQATMTQTIDLTEAADFIDGAVYGVKYATSQFFAYVGAGITDYKIKVQTIDGEKILNYYIGDSEDVFHRIIGDPAVSPEGKKLTYDSDLFKLKAKYRLLPNTDIEIIPMVHDVTTISLDFLNEAGEVLQTETVEGPNATDVWAIKEKVYFPLTLWGIFEFLQPNNNNITVFGQKYSDTNALKPFFTVADQQQGGILGQGEGGPASDFISDINAKFLLRKFPFGVYGGAYPPNYWYAADGASGGSPGLKGKTNDRALNDYGAAAMFGVGKETIVPYKTRSVKITVTFSHTSEIIKDVNPELKGWTSQEIYSNEHGQSTSISKRLSEYGNPRCGVTKMKFLLAPNDLTISDKYVSYTLPPNKSTTLGVMKNMYSDPNAFNTADRTQFTYNIATPEPLPEPPKPSSVFTSAKNEQEYLDSLNRNFTSLPGTTQVKNQSTGSMGTASEIQEQEDADFDKGDYRNITGREF